MGAALTHSPQASTQSVTTLEGNTGQPQGGGAHPLPSLYEASETSQGPSPPAAVTPLRSTEADSTRGLRLQRKFQEVYP